MLIADLPQRCRSEIVWIACIKRALATRNLPSYKRLELLEWLGSCASGSLTAAAMEAIEPASDGLVEAIAKVTRLNPSSPESAFAMLGRRDVFADLCEFHPSLLMAITLCWTRH